MFESPVRIVNLARAARLTCGRTLSRWLAATLLPPRCCLCGFEGQWPDLDLCDTCDADLPWELMRVPALTALRYTSPVSELIRALKYDGAVAHARVLGELLARAARDDPHGVREMPALLLPVPLHRARFRERGFNQAAKILRQVSRSLGVPGAEGLVVRSRDTPSQTGLGAAERRANLEGAFALAGDRARRRVRAAGHVALIDDVYTTGSTCEAMRQLLLDAGVRRVECWAVARAAADQARPAFFRASSGGPSNRASGTLPT